MEWIGNKNSTEILNRKIRCSKWRQKGNYCPPRILYPAKLLIKYEDKDIFRHTNICKIYLVGYPSLENSWRMVKGEETECKRIVKRYPRMTDSCASNQQSNQSNLEQSCGGRYNQENNRYECLELFELWGKKY